MREQSYIVAGLVFAVQAPTEWDLDALLPSFRPFQASQSGTSAAPTQLFTMAVVPEPYRGGKADLLSESDNDMGHVALWRTSGGYAFDLSYDSAYIHTMTADPLFSEITFYAHPDDIHLKMVLTSLLRIAFAQAALAHQCISVHSSCVVLDGAAYLFLGKSGTGKSTHARQWLAAFEGSYLLNDDNPALRIEDGKVVAYGTPWSGKTPCYKNERHPVAGIVRLKQAPANIFRPISGPEAFAALLPSCSSIKQDSRLQDLLLDTLIAISETVAVGQMECLPDTDAAKACLKGLQSTDNNNNTTL